MVKEKLHIIPSEYTVTAHKRALLGKCRPKVLWFTGLSGSGKSTIANIIDQELHAKGVRSYFLDGDNIRSGLNKGLTFTEEDRKENMRRVAEVAKLFVDSGTLLLCSFVSPFRNARNMVREIIGSDNYIEIYIKTSVEECTKRDPKGLYKKALSGEISNFTGISSPYEEPLNPALVVETVGKNPEECAQEVIDFITSQKLITT